VHFAYVVYKLTFPNGKIYVGKDIGLNGHSVRYFGSWSNCLVEADFTKEELSDFIVRKQILFESKDKAEVNRKEVEFIRALKFQRSVRWLQPVAKKTSGQP
jgi:hypothetical protein